MTDSKPCRLKACKGVTHRNGCPRRKAYGRKGGRVAGQPLTASEKAQRVKASKSPRTPSASRNQAVTRSNIKRIEERMAQGVCPFCGLNHDGLCKVASQAGSIGGRMARTINQTGINNRAKVEAAHVADLKRRSFLNTRPHINLQAIPATYPLDCIKCNSTKGANLFQIGFADDVGYGLCKICDESIDSAGGE